MIFAARQLLKKCRENNDFLFVLFLDQEVRCGLC